MFLHEITLTCDSGPCNFLLTDAGIIISHSSNRTCPVLQVPLRNILWAGICEHAFLISLLAETKPRKPLELIHITAAIAELEKSTASEFAEAVLCAAYAGIGRNRRLKVFVNPRSGPGRSVARYRKIIEPIFKAAKCEIDLTITTHVGHAQEEVQKLPLDQFDAIVAVSGDGLVYEVFNGYAGHAEPAKAFCVPVAPIPTGSGNGLALNIIGIDEFKDLSVSALNAIKGTPMNIDLFSILQRGKRYISFMCQSLGLMADVDLGSEPLRFMGQSRFVLGFIYQVLFKHKSCPIKVSMKIAHSNKAQMLQDMKRARTSAETCRARALDPTLSGSDFSGLPPLKHIGPGASEEGWVTFEVPFTYMLAGKGPYVTPDFIQFPVSVPCDGTIDIVFQERRTRMTMLKAIEGAELGKPFWTDMQHYFKAYAYRIEPLSPTGFLSIDGESFPLEPYELEVHQGLGCLLSMYGYYNVDFDVSPQSKQLSTEKEGATGARTP